MQTCDIWSYKQPSDRNLVISQLSQSSPVASLNSNFNVVSTCWMTFQWWSLSLFLGLLFVCSLSLIVWTKTMMPVVRTVRNLWKKSEKSLKCNRHVWLNCYCSVFSPFRWIFISFCCRSRPLFIRTRRTWRIKCKCKAMRDKLQFAPFFLEIFIYYDFIYQYPNLTREYSEYWEI